MKIEDICRIIGAEILCGEDLRENEALSACGADLLSDVLAFTKEKTLLLTGLTNPQVVRAAELIGLAGLVFVRGKKPPAEVIVMARKRGIPILSTTLPLYEACGLLYAAGLPGCRFGLGQADAAQ